jgi:hypothetical protein
MIPTPSSVSELRVVSTAGGSEDRRKFEPTRPTDSLVTRARKSADVEKAQFEMPSRRGVRRSGSLGTAVG